MGYGGDACPPLTRTPLEVVELPVRFVSRIHAAQFKLHAFALQHGMDPTGGLALLEDVTHRRKINQMNSALVLPNIPGMGVSEDVGLNLFSGPNDGEEGGGVLQPDISGKTRIMMD